MLEQIKIDIKRQASHMQ